MFKITHTLVEDIQCTQAETNWEIKFFPLTLQVSKYSQSDGWNDNQAL